MKIGSLFSGYGGLELGAQMILGGEVAWHSEIDKNASQILAHHWPDVPNLGDITEVDWPAVEPVDVLVGGFPCQPVSAAGKRRGVTDERWLFDEILTAIRNLVLPPQLCVFENVLGLLTANGGDAMARVVEGLASVGYVGRYGVYRASDVGAPHRRARVFIVAWPSFRHPGHDARSAEQWLESQITTRWATEPGGSDAADSGGERHGPRLHGTRVGRMDGADESPSREREWPRQITGHRGAPTSHLMPTPVADNSRGLPQTGTDYASLPNVVTMLPTPRAARGASATETVEMLPTPKAADGEFGLPRTSGRPPEKSTHLATRLHYTDFGQYTGAIERWEPVIGRPAPAPTEPTGKHGKPRLSPAFVEWMMGLPEGHITDTKLPRTAQLKALGNGVVPQQAALAVIDLLREFQ